MRADAAPRPVMGPVMGLVLALVIGACAGQSAPPRPSIPPLADLLSPTTIGEASGSNPVEEGVLGSCRLTLGEGMGAVVEEFVDGTKADRVLQAGDVIHEIDGVPAETSAEVASVAGGLRPGDRIALVITRDGDEMTVQVEISENPEQAGAPMMGVVVRTVLDQVRPAALPKTQSAAGGPPARLVRVDGDLFALDPIDVTWTSLDVESPDVFVPLAGEAYVLEVGTGDRPATLTGLLEQTRIEVRSGTWRALRLLTSVGDLALMTGGRETEDGEEYGVLAIDPVGGEMEWDWPAGADDAGAPRFPFQGRVSSGRELALIATTTDGNLPTFSHAVLDPQGREVSGWPDDPAGPLRGRYAGGWFDRGSIVFLSDLEEPGLSTVDPLTGELSPLPLGTLDLTQVTNLWAVGDGRHLLTSSAAGNLVRVELAEGGAQHLLTQGCAVTTGDSGWAG